MKLERKSLLAGVVAIAAIIICNVSHAAVVSWRGVDGFYTSDDGYNHAVVGKTDGTVYEVYWYTGGTAHSTLLGSFGANSIVAVAGYFTPNDGFRHAIVALTNGQIWEIYFNPNTGAFSDLLTTLGSPIASISGHVSPDGHQNVIVATGPYLYDVRFGLGQGVSVYYLGYGIIGGYNIRDVASYYDPVYGDEMIVSIPDNITGINFGQVWWTTFGTFNHNSMAILNQSPNGGNGIGAFPVSGWGYYDTMVGCDGSDTYLEEYTYSHISGAYESHAWHFTYGPGMLAEGGFGQPNGSSPTIKHAIVAMTNGDIWDMYNSGSGWTYSPKLGVF